MKAIQALMGCFLSLLVLGAVPMSSLAQSDVNYFFTTCEDRAVVELNGNMNNNFDVYVQFFLGAGGTGEPLTGLTRMNITNRGAYRVTRIVSYTGGTAPLGTLVSMYLALAPVGGADNPVYTDIVDDFQDGCVEATGASTISGGNSGVGVPTSAVQGVDPRTGETVNLNSGELIVSSGILKPGFGTLNEIFAVNPEGVVQIGARPSENPGFYGNRMPDAGLIYAECLINDLARPGTLYDTDNLTVYWFWWARTASQVYDHMRNAQYAITVAGQPMPFVETSPVVRREDGLYYVFYTADLGSGWREGSYEVGFELTWANAITDGFDDYGPGTDNPVIRSGCPFSVRANPYGLRVERINPTIPLQQHLNRP